MLPLWPGVGICDIQLLLYYKVSIHQSIERNELPEATLQKKKLHFRNTIQIQKKGQFIIIWKTAT